MSISVLIRQEVSIVNVRMVTSFGQIRGPVLNLGTRQVHVGKKFKPLINFLMKVQATRKIFAL